MAHGRLLVHSHSASPNPQASVSHPTRTNPDLVPGTGPRSMGRRPGATWVPSSTSTTSPVCPFNSRATAPITRPSCSTGTCWTTVKSRCTTARGPLRQSSTPTSRPRPRVGVGAIEDYGDLGSQIPTSKRDMSTPSVPGLFPPRVGPTTPRSPSHSWCGVHRSVGPVARKGSTDRRCPEKRNRGSERTTPPQEVLSRGPSALGGLGTVLPGVGVSSGHTEGRVSGPPFPVPDTWLHLYGTGDPVWEKGRVCSIVVSPSLEFKCRVHTETLPRSVTGTRTRIISSVPPQGVT